MLIGLFVVVIVLIALYVVLYNRLVSLRVRAENAWSDIDAGPMGYHELEFFEASAGERELPKVSF